MPEKFDRCVKDVMASGKSKDSAHAICTAQFKDHLTGKFRDAVTFNGEEKTAVSVRDGVLEYLGIEIGMHPQDKIFTIYRTPATIANAAMAMPGIPITDDHVSLDSAPPTSGGTVTSSRMITAADEKTSTTIAIENKIAIGDTLLPLIMSGKRELSLGYMADLVPHDVYDFEQKNIVPHHLAAVDRGRCGSMCSFIDKTPIVKGDPDMLKLHKAFSDENGTMNLQQIVELATALPEAIKSVPVDQLQELLPALQQIVEAAKSVAPEMVEEVAMPEDKAETTDAVKDEEIEKKEPGFSDSDVKRFTDEAIKAHTDVITKARDFLDDDYVFTGKSTNQIMIDALAKDSGQKFSDSELPLAFKMLKKTESNYKNFGDTKPDDFDSLQDKEL